ncbi:hypothetical protein GO286_04855 [Ralstonia solanacearum]|nr:hypothetical protein [Ralstonia solanacearum]
MTTLEREAQVVRLGEDDARDGMGSRARDFQTVSEQLAYLRGYESPSVVKKLNAILFVACLVALLCWTVWGFSVQLDAMKYGSTIALATGWDAVGYCGLWVPVLIVLCWCMWHRK